MNAFFESTASGVATALVLAVLGAGALWTRRNFDLDVRRTNRWFRVSVERLDLIRGSVLTARFWPRGGGERYLLPNSVRHEDLSSDWGAPNSVLPVEQEIGTAVGVQTVQISFSTRSRKPITIFRVDIRVLQRDEPLEGWFRVPLGLGGGSTFIEGVADLDGNPPVFAQLTAWNGKGQTPDLEIPRPFDIARDDALHLALTVFTSDGTVRWGIDLVGSDGSTEMTIPFRDPRFVVTAADESRQSGWLPAAGMTGNLTRRATGGTKSISEDVSQLRTALGRTRFH